jgi:hypothetical protein
VCAHHHCGVRWWWGYVSTPGPASKCRHVRFLSSERAVSLSSSVSNSLSSSLSNSLSSSLSNSLSSVILLTVDILSVGRLAP